MKKNHLILIAGLSCLLLVGCGTKSVPTDTINTGMLFSGEQTLTGMQSGENMGDQNATMREEVSGETPNGSLSITGKTTVQTTTGGDVSSDVTDLIKARATKPADDNKLTEDDIDLIDEIIQKIQDIGN